MATKCPQCNTSNPDTVKFCGECGSQLIPLEKASPPTKTLEVPARELARGMTLAGRYEVIEELGKGGMGKVYRVEDKKIRQEIALKLINPEIAADKKTIERFSNELKLARMIAHKNVCRMFDLGEAEGMHFITMEYIRGEDLKNMIRMSGQLSVATAIHIGTQICEGLTEAHRLGVIHRDLKPSNILIDRDGNVRIMDFGIARILRVKGMTDDGLVIGTPEYMSPEQVEGKGIDVRSDLYSLGIILYEMLTGRVPFEGDTPFAVGVKHQSAVPPNPREFNSQIPEELSQLILKCLEKNRAKRYQSAAEVQEALGRRAGVSKAGETKRPATHRERKSTLVRIRSIAVLPLANLSRDPEQDYFADGMTEELITTLAKIGSLRVISRTSAMRYKGTDKTLREVARELNVDGIVEGSVRRAGDRVRITAQLIDAAGDRHIWAESYERNVDDVLALQSEVAKAIADEIQVKLTPQERARLARTVRVMPDAYEAYLKGLQEFAKFTPDGLTKGVEYLEQSIQKDPHFAPSQAALAECFCWYGVMCVGPSKAIFPRARAAAARAVQLDESLAEAHASLALTKWAFDWDWPGAERDFKRATALNPSSARARYHYAIFLMTMGRFDEAIAEATASAALDPLSATSVEGVSMAYIWAGQYDRAIVHSKKVLAMDPNNAWAWITLAFAWAQKGTIHEAITACENAAALSPPGRNLTTDTWLAASYVLCDRSGDAAKLLKIWEGLANQQHVDAGQMVVFYAWLSRMDRGFEWAQKGLEERSPIMPFYKTSPLGTDEERSDPRWPGLLRRIGFPEKE